MENDKVGIIGDGFIGKLIAQSLLMKGITPNFVGNSKIISYKDLSFKERKVVAANENNYREAFSTVGVVFNCMSTKDDGAKAHSLNMIMVREQNGILIGSEKGSWGNYGYEQKKYIKQFGYSAVVGGSSLLLDYINTYFSQNVNVIRCVLNGSTNLIMFLMGEGYQFENAVTVSDYLGCIEPDHEEPKAILNGEVVGDAMKKIAALHSIVGLNPQLNLTARELEQVAQPLTDDCLKELQANPNLYRFMVSFERYGTEAERTNHQGAIAILDYKAQGDFRIIAAFERVNREPFSQLVLPSVNNGVVFNDNGVVYPGRIGAEGAGPYTIGALMHDFRRLCLLNI